MLFRGRVAYPEALQKMEARRSAILAGEKSPGLLLCEHDPVITRGRHANDKNLLVSQQSLAAQGIDLVAIDRGGDLTYHGPGQLMIYPVVLVGVAVRAYLECIALVLAETAAEFNVDACWRRDEPGLWVGDRKLAACGLHLRRGVSIHGFSFNLSTPPEAWRWIVPCGLQGPGPISLVEAMESSEVPSLEALASIVERRLVPALERYGLDPGRPDSLD